jgi:beta-glucanase (GH16 family)
MATVTFRIWAVGLAAAAVFAVATSAAAPADARPKASTKASTEPCGGSLAKSGGGTWRCSFADEFSGSALNGAKWIAQRTDTSGYINGLTACFVDSPNNISVSNGSLKLTARKEAAPFNCGNQYYSFPTQYTSGMVTTALGRFSQAYGRFEVRAKLWSASVKGLHTAFWLWPLNQKKYGAWPASGEIDIAEMYSAYPDRAIPYIHYNAQAIDPNVTNTSCMISDLAAFHTYTVEWTPSAIKIIYDGRTCLIDKWNPLAPLVSPQPFDQPFIISLTQALGIGGNAFDPATTPLPATTVVDYVRVWK